MASFEDGNSNKSQDPVDWNNKGIVLRSMGRYQDALTSFNKAIELDPSYGVAQQNKELVLQDIDQNSQADPDFPAENVL